MDEKKIVLFGTGQAASNMLNRIGKNRVAYIVDNNSKKWGDVFCGFKVYSPRVILKEEKSNLLIYIGSSYYLEIARQLLSWGFEENKHFVGIDHAEFATNKPTPITVLNDLPSLKLSHYQKAQMNLIDYVSSKYMLSSVYNFGDISTPSISDLDLIFVIDESVERLEEAMETFKYLIKEPLYCDIFIHPPIVINKSMTRYLRLFHTVKKLNRVFGQEISWGEEAFFEEKVLIWSYHFYQKFWSWSRQDTVYYRRACLMIKNLYHSLENNSKRYEDYRFLEEARKEVLQMRMAALENHLDIPKLNESLGRLWYMICVQEQFEPVPIEEFAYFNISLFQNHYIHLRDDILHERGAYRQEVEMALEYTGMSYAQASRLFGAVPIFDFGSLNI